MVHPVPRNAVPRVDQIQSLLDGRNANNADLSALLLRIDIECSRRIFYAGSEPYDNLSVCAAIDAGLIKLVMDNDWLDPGERFTYRLTSRGRKMIGLPQRRSLLMYAREKMRKLFAKMPRRDR